MSRKLILKIFSKDLFSDGRKCDFMRLRCNETRLLREVYVDISDHIAKLLGVNLVICNRSLKRYLVILLAFGVALL